MPLELAKVLCLAVIRAALVAASKRPHFKARAPARPELLVDYVVFEILLVGVDILDVHSHSNGPGGEKDEAVDPT